MRCTSFLAARAFGTSWATIRRSCILGETGEGTRALADIVPSILPGMGLFRAVSLVGSHIFRLDQVKPDALNAVAKAEHARRAVAQIHNPVADVGAAVIDPYHNPLTVSQVGHLNKRSQRELPVGCGYFKHVKILPTGRGSAVKLLTVPGGVANLVGFRCCFLELKGELIDLRQWVAWNGSRPHVGNRK